MIYEKTLSNGLELVVKKTNVPVVAIQVWVDVGSIDETPGQAGFCHFIEHMLFKGTKKRTTQQIAGNIEGAGGEMNAFTSFEYTVYHITLSNENWKLANEILSDMVLNSVFKDGEFKPEKEVILEEINRTYDSPERQLYQAVFKNFYGTSTYGRPVIGFPKTIKPCTASQLKSFWSNWYLPELMTVVVCGDVDIQDVEKEVLNTWGKHKAKKSAPRSRRRETAFRAPFQRSISSFSHKNFPINTIKWSGAIPACSVRSDDLAALDLASMTLGQGEASRLHQVLYQKKGVVTSVGTGVWTPAGDGLFTIDVETSIEGNPGKFRTPLFDEIQRFLKEGPQKDELERAKNIIESDKIYSLQSMEGLAHRLGLLKVTLNNVRYDLEYGEKCKELTAEEIRLTTEKYFNQTPLREMVLLPTDMKPEEFWPQEIVKQLSHETLPKKSKSKSVNAKTGGATSDSTVKFSPALNLSQIDLENGIKLVLNPRSDLAMVSIQASLLGGSRSETREQAGIGNIFSDIWEKGPKGWSSEKLAHFLESKATSLDGFSGRNSLGLSMTTLTQNLPEVLDIFIETLLNPKLEEVDFTRSKMVALEDIQSIEDRPERLVMKMFYQSFYQQHPYSYPIVGFKESVTNLTLEKIREYFEQRVKTAPLVISVSGKFDPTTIIEKFSKIKRQFNLKHSDSIKLSFSAPQKEMLSELQKNREQSHLLVGFKGLSLSDKERYDLKVLLNLLGGQSGRLFRNLRDKQGLCYTVAPTSFEGIEPGFVGVYMGFAPNKREQALKGIFSELAALSKKPLSREEIERAKRFLQGRYDMDLQLNSAIASTAGLNALYGLGFDEHTKMKDRLIRVSPESVRSVARKIFSGPAVTAVVI